MCNFLSFKSRPEKCGLLLTEIQNTGLVLPGVDGHFRMLRLNVIYLLC
jgi:hypothetical protein